jgi:hypothetical protein
MMAGHRCCSSEPRDFIDLALQAATPLATPAEPTDLSIAMTIG